MTVSPVISATRFIMELETTEKPALEGIELCKQLAVWVSDRDHLPTDCYEAMSLVFYLAVTLHAKKLISVEEGKQLVSQVSGMLPSPQAAEKEQCPVKGLPDTVDSFERLLRWLSICDKTHPEYQRSTSRIFSLPLNMLDENLITKDTKEVMLQRAFQVLVKNPRKRISNPDFASFLKNLGFQRLKSH